MKPRSLFCNTWSYTELLRQASRKTIDKLPFSVLVNPIARDPYDSDPCQNGGTCTNLGINNFECKCAPGSGGDTCEGKKPTFTASCCYLAHCFPIRRHILETGHPKLEKNRGWFLWKEIDKNFSYLLTRNYLGPIQKNYNWCKFNIWINTKSIFIILLSNTKS